MSKMIEFAKEVDGRWIADYTEMPGMMRYGITKKEALKNLQELFVAFINEYPKYFSKQVTDARWREMFGVDKEKRLDKKKKQRKVKSSRKNKK